MITAPHDSSFTGNNNSLVKRYRNHSIFEWPFAAGFDFIINAGGKIRNSRQAFKGYKSLARIPARRDVSAFGRVGVTRPTGGRVATSGSCRAIVARRGKLIPALALLLVTCQPVWAATQCMFPSERTSFDVRTLQSLLMVAALTCDRRDEYNLFMKQHQRDLMAAHDRIGAYFVRLHGPAGEEERDAYVSELGNVHALEGARQGPGYCGRIKPVVLEALTLQNIEGISRFVAERRVTSPYLMQICEDMR